MASMQKRGERSWLLVVEAGYKADGTREKETRTVKIDDDAVLKSKRLREEFLRDQLHMFKQEVESGIYVKPTKMTLEKFIENEWIPKYACKEENLSPLSFKTYKHHITNHILPVFGHKKLEEIKTIHVVTFINDLGKPGARKDGKGDTLSSGTIQYIYRVLKNILQRATEWQFIKANPMAGVKKPRVEETECEFYDEVEARAVITALYKEPRRWRLLVLGAMIGGFRRGELLGLEWPDVDAKNGVLGVVNSISLTEDGKAVEKGPKSRSSKRQVDFPDWYMAELEIHRKEWIKEKWDAQEKWLGGDREFVFHAGFGKPFYHSYPTEWWNKFVKRHELKKVRFHDLRHSAATLLIEAGASMKAIQKRLGHAKHQTTADTYAHVTKKLSRDTAEKFNKFAPENFRQQSVNNSQKEDMA
ncbi:site-specific integrase [Paenibacillus sp. 598K]|uniref:tyrosine-type recombinase/integrase n=1 Tax=Paenibacillus sp. 598K TaxID=1117987 RepID=UPI000FFA5731|nr:site-specific integrase [Paenibacillus sp. 598K]GBF78280.1 site-specific integrase [Paenibacillus sp. 598K]